MAMIQQNISGVKLERMRKKARRRMRIAKGVRWGTFGAGVLFTLALSMRGLIQMLPLGVSADTLIGFAGMTFGGVLISFLVSLILYLCTVWITSKPWDEFSKNYKNKYVLVKLREFPGFSQLKYAPDRSLPTQELCQACLPPTQNPPLIRSMDYWEGVYDCVRFRAAQLDVWPYQSHTMLFGGQAMIFPCFMSEKSARPRCRCLQNAAGRSRRV